jgi:HD-like signal output (HDOD) protein
MVLRGAEQLTPGMVLAQDISNALGKLLLPRGTVLEEEHVRVLQEERIGTVRVGQTAGGEQDLGSLAETYLTPLFSSAGREGQVQAEVFRLGKVRIERLLEQGWIPPQKSPPPPQGTTPLPADPESSPQDLVSRDLHFVSFSDIYFKIREELISPRSTSARIASVIAKDTSLTAKLLRLVNSPIYGFPSKIESITRAITLVGLEELSSLALGISAIKAFEDVAPELIDMKEFWTHSIAVGTLARIIAARKGLAEERFFIAGMLHDVGKLLLFSCRPNRISEAYVRSRAHLMPLFETERQVFGFDHALIGGMLLKRWNLPPTLETLVRDHHQPLLATDRLGASIVHCADFLANGLQFAPSGSAIVPPLQQDSWEALGVNPAEIETISRQAEGVLQEIMHIFFDV